MLDLSLFENQFLEVSFDHKSHTYRINDNEGFISVTTLIKKFEPEFDVEDATKKALRKPENKGKTKDQLQTEWKAKGESSSNKGSSIHNYIENTLKNIPVEVDPRFQIEKDYFNNFQEDFLKNKNVVYSEKILYLKTFKIVGTIDCLVYCPEEDILYFIDWKTNEKISYENRYRNFKPPLQKYQHCSKEIYTLQLSMYRYIIENTILNNYPSLPNMKNILVHLSKENRNYQIHELPYYKYSVQQILKQYNQKD